MTPAEALAALTVVVAAVNATTRGGVIAFAVGITVGLLCVLLLDRHLRRRSHAARRAWQNGGGPERRSFGDRRARRHAPDS